MAGRENAGDCEASAVQNDRMANGGQSAIETFSPEAIADDGRGRSADAIAIGRKRRPGDELYSESAEEIRRDFVTVKVLRETRTDQVKARRLKRGDLLEEASIATPVEKIGIGNLGGAFEAAIVEERHYETVRFAIWQRLEEHALQGCENCGICPKA